MWGVRLFFLVSTFVMSRLHFFRFGVHFFAFGVHFKLQGVHFRRFTLHSLSTIFHPCIILPNFVVEKSRAALVGAVLHKVKTLQQWDTKD